MYDYNRIMYQNYYVLFYSLLFLIYLFYFFNLQDAFQFYTRNHNLKHMISEVRKDLSLYHQYKNNKDFIKFLNFFAEKSRALPHGWASKIDNSGKVNLNNYFMISYDENT